jgi:drug/metabolite transporter (DMT)-like permease
MFKARILLFLTAVIWGATFVATKICLKYLSPIELMGLRFLIAMPILLVIILIKKVKFQLGDYRKNIAWASIVLTAHFIIQITGIKYTTATNTSWIISMIPLIVAVLAFLFLKERLRSVTIFGIVLATIGVLFLISKGKIGDLKWLSSFGDWLVLISAHTWAVYTILTRNASRKLDPLLVTFCVLLPSTIISLSIMIFSSDWHKFLNLSGEAIVSLLLLGLLGTALAQLLWQDGVAKIGAAEASVYLYIEPLATTAVAVPYLHETFGLFTAIGGGLVLLGVWIAGRQQKA